MMVRDVHGHGANIHYRADDTAIGGTSDVGAGGHGGTDTGDLNPSSQERLRNLMNSESALRRSKTHADRTISRQGTENANKERENAELRQRIATLERNAASPQAATLGAGDSAQASYDPDDPDTARWDQQRQINEEMMRRLGVLVESHKHQLTQSIAQKRTTDAEQGYRDKVHVRYGGDLSADVEQFLVDARMTGDYEKVLEADAAVSAALRDGAADLSTSAASGQLGLGGAGGLGAGSRASAIAPLDMSLSDDDLKEIAAEFPNDREGQAAASLTKKLDRLMAGDTT
jgi:hypothetical protein